MASAPNERPDDEVVHSDESASSEEEDTNSTAENAELGNRDQALMESLIDFFVKIDINVQHAGQDSTSSRPTGAAASPVDDVNPGHGVNTNSKKLLDQLNREHVKITTYILCEHAFTVDELSSKTLTGRGKGTKADEGRKLDENRVSAVVDTVQNIHPVPKEKKKEQKKVIENHITAIHSSHLQRERRETSKKNEENDKQ